MVFISYFWSGLKEKNTNMEWHFYNFTKLFLKDITTDIIYWESTNWESQIFCIDAQFYIFSAHVFLLQAFTFYCKCLAVLPEYEEVAFAS